MSFEEIADFKIWLAELLECHAVEIRERSLVVHSEFDSRFQMRRGRRLETALEGLFRFVFSTLPNGCEIYLASSRTLASIASLESGMLSLRWQVAGNARRPALAGVTTIRPIAGGAAFHAQSGAAVGLEQAFRDAGWSFSVDATNGDRELRVCASTRMR
jgi:hypothetical protein